MESQVIEIGISQFGPALDRKIYVLDRNHDLYVASANVGSPTSQPQVRAIFRELILRANKT